MGDGALWIKKGLSIIPQVTFVLDRFHLQKRIKGAPLSPERKRALHRALQEGNRKRVKAIIGQALLENEDPKKRAILKELLVYLSRNFEGIQNLKKFKALNLGGSAEGHVSHSLSPVCRVVLLRGVEEEPIG